MKLSAWIEVYVDGKLVRRQRCRSFVENWGRLILHALSGEDIQVTRQDGSSAKISSGASCFRVFWVGANAGEDWYGILVGAGTKAVEFTDYALEKKIPHGTGEGQLEYSDVALQQVYADGTVVRLEIIRTFTNNSGSDITISEIGLAVHGDYKYPLIERTVLDSPVTVKNGASVTIKYVIEHSL